MIAGLATHLDGRLDVKVELLVGLDKRVQALDVLELGVTVEQEGRVVGIGNVALVECLQVRREVSDALCVKELRNVLVFFFFPFFASIVIRRTLRMT